MSLQLQLEKLKEKIRENIPEDTLDVMVEAGRELRESGIAERCLKEGEVMPSFDLPSHDGTHYNSEDLLKAGPLVLSFFRGVW